MSKPSLSRRIGAACIVGALVAGSSTIAMQRSALGAPDDAAEAAIADSLKGLAKPGEFSGITLRFATRHQTEVVPDPYTEGSAGFERTLDYCEDACAGVLAALRARLDPAAPG